MTVRCEKLELAVGRRRILGPLDLDLPAGCRVAVLGASGTGKTTLLRTLAGLMPAAAGRVWIGDRLATDGARTILPPNERGISMVFQDLGLWPHMTVRQHLEFASGGRTRRDMLRDLVELVGLSGMDRRRPASLSGGERQRLALIRALASGPRRLLLDEPFTSLDLVLKLSLCELVSGLQKRYGFTLVLVTHDPLEALRLADRIVLLQPGSIVWDGPAVEFLSSGAGQLEELNRALDRWTSPPEPNAR